jgi:type I restriction enzyme R subunit
MSDRLDEILQKFKDDWDALERELKKFIAELKQGDRQDFPNLDPRVQVPFVRLVLEQSGMGGDTPAPQREAAIRATLSMIERIQQEVRKVGFWKNPELRELLTKMLVRDLSNARINSPTGERDLAQRLVALAKENHIYLTR